MIYQNVLDLKQNYLLMKLTKSNTCKTKLSFEVNGKITKVKLWMKMNKLTIKYHKTKSIIFNRKKHFNNSKVNIDNHDIEQVKQMNYQSIVFDDKLTWKSHVQHICAKLSNRSSALLN